jgi:hypothetical protein
MVDRTDLLRAPNLPGLVVPDHCVQLDPVPQFPADVDELLQPVVAGAMLHELVKAVVRRVGAPGRGDDVERDPPAGDVVQRVETAVFATRPNVA